MPPDARQATSTRAAGLLADAEVRTLPPYAVVLVRDRDPDVMQELSAALAHVGRSDVLIVDVGGDDWFEILDVPTMREHGWVRADQP